VRRALCVCVGGLKTMNATGLEGPQAALRIASDATCPAGGASEASRLLCEPPHAYALLDLPVCRRRRRPPTQRPQRPQRWLSRPRPAVRARTRCRSPCPASLLAKQSCQRPRRWPTSPPWCWSSAWRAAGRPRLCSASTCTWCRRRHRATSSTWIRRCSTCRTRLTLTSETRWCTKM
jgi:hypothetical protein